MPPQRPAAIDSDNPAEAPSSCHTERAAASRIAKLGSANLCRKAGTARRSAGPSSRSPSSDARTMIFSGSGDRARSTTRSYTASPSAESAVVARARIAASSPRVAPSSRGQ